MKEGKQQQKFIIKVKTTSGVEKIFTTTNVLSANRTYSHTELSDIIQELAKYSISAATTDPIIKLDQQVTPPGDNDTIQVPTALLADKALDYALADALDWIEPFYDLGKISLDDTKDHYLTYAEPDPDESYEDHPLKASNMTYYSEWAPSRRMALAGWLMKKYKISVQPTGHEIANPPVEAVYKQSDFDTDPAKVTAPTYEQAICLAFVYRNNGQWTSIPADFEKYLTPQTV